MQLSEIDITGTAIADNSNFRFQYNGNITITGAAGRTFTNATFHLAGNTITYVN